MIKTTTVSLEQFKNACGFTLNIAAWGNRRKANIKKVETDADKDRLSLTKTLVKCQEYDTIRSYFTELRSWVYEQTVPSFFQKGFQLASLAAVSTIENKMKKAQQEDLPKLVASFQAVYPAKIEEAKEALKDQWQARDYPPVEMLPQLFKISWNWLAFTVPQNLPPELQAKEQDKLERQLADAGQQITEALRTSFQELISHATERLTTAPGEKEKIFKDSLIGNITQFIETFNQRNLMNDVQLAELVGRAKDILAKRSVKDVRKFASVKEEVRTQFAAIQKTLDGMIATKNTRAFDLSED